MSLLEQYEHQYATLIAEITAQIGKLQLFNGLERREQWNKIEGELSEAQELLEQISLEIRDLNVAQRPSATSKLQCAQAELKRLQTEFRNAKDKQQRQQHTALDISSDDYYDDVSISNDQRQRLLDNSERIERTGNRLTDGYRVALETEQLGAQVLNDLSSQRETLHNARNRIRETNAELGRASRTLNTMLLRALREKVVLWTVGTCFVIAVVISLYLSFSSTPASA